MKRVDGLIKAELAEIIDQKVTDPDLPQFVTIYSVKVSKDLRSAEVNVTLLEDEDEQSIRKAVKVLNKASGFIRSELGRAIHLKYVPGLRFHYNPSTRYAVELEKVFQKIEPGFIIHGRLFGFGYIEHA